MRFIVFRAKSCAIRQGPRYGSWDSQIQRLPVVDELPDGERRDREFRIFDSSTRALGVVACCDA